MKLLIDHTYAIKNFKKLGVVAAALRYLAKIKVGMLAEENFGISHHIFHKQDCRKYYRKLLS